MGRPSQKTGIAVVIPTYRPDERLSELIRRLRAQSFVPERIFIVNTEQDLFRDELVDFRSGVSVLHIGQADFDHAATRNLAVQMVKTPVVVFMTQDALPADRFLLENLMAGFVRAGEDGKEAAVVYARQLARKEAGEAERYGRNFSYPDESRTKSEEDLEELGIMTFTCSDVCAAYQRDLFLSLGGFEAPAIFNEDMVFAAKAIRAGFAVRYEAQAKVIHSHSLSPIQQLHRNFDLGVSQADHPEVFDAVPSEGTGMKLVKGTVLHLVRKGRPFEIPAFLTGAAFRLAGYRLGKNYRRLPPGLCRKLSGSGYYWNKNRQVRREHGQGSRKS